MYMYTTLANSVALTIILIVDLVIQLRQKCRNRKKMSSNKIMDHSPPKEPIEDIVNFQNRTRSYSTHINEVDNSTISIKLDRKTSVFEENKESDPPIQLMKLPPPKPLQLGAYDEPRYAPRIYRLDGSRPQLG